MTTTVVTVPVGPKVALVDFGGTGVDLAQLIPCAAALAKQANTQFALPPPLGWGVGVQAMRVCQRSEVQPDEWLLALIASPDVPGALGYHDRTPSGLPFMKVFPPLDRQDGVDWRVTASHELLETLADPEICRGAQSPYDGKWWATEVCDAVEQDTYLIDGVPMSNWNTSAYFEPPTNLTGLKLDWLGLCKKPYEIRPGGYGQYWDGSNWVQVGPSGSHAARSYRAGDHRGRRALRTERVAEASRAKGKSKKK